MDKRQQLIENWLTSSCQLNFQKIEPLVADASFRRYFRVWTEAGTRIVMDAPPEWETTTPQYVVIAKALRTLGLQVPEIMATDFVQGFLLISDLGDKLYLKELSLANAEELYTRALTALAVMQSCRKIHNYNIPPFTANFMLQELELFKEWFLQTHLRLTLSATQEKMLTEYFQFLAYSCAEQPQVFMHRDFHSANLMVLPDDGVGILDFQDAFMGPVTYDLVSLLRDCYIAFPEALIQKLILEYKVEINLPGSAEAFLQSFHIMSMQRHLKALLTFSRKYHRDKNINYLQHIPRTLDYVKNAVERFPQCKEFKNFLNESMLPALDKVKIICVQ